MKRYLFLLFGLWLGFSAQAQTPIIPPADQEILGRMAYLNSLPEGTHKIYNGKGNTVFDVLYTIEVGKEKTTVYKGGSKFHFDALYSIEFDGDRYKIFRGPSSVFNQIYTILLTPEGYEIYKGDSTFSSGLLYTYER